MKRPFSELLDHMASLVDELAGFTTYVTAMRATGEHCCPNGNDGENCDGVDCDCPCHAYEWQ